MCFLDPLLPEKPSQRLIINNTAETSDYFLLKSCSAGHPFSKYLKILAQKTFNAFTKNLVSDLNSSISVFKKSKNSHNRYQIDLKVTKLTSQCDY